MSADAARAVLNKLLDRIERQSEDARARPVSMKLPQSFDSARAREDFEAVLHDAARAGAVTLEQGRGEVAHLLARIRLADSARLYGFLGRTPARDAAEAAIATLDAMAGAPVHAADARDSLAAHWRADRAYLGLTRRDVEAAAAFLVALDAVLAGDFGGRDMRTVSRKRTGHSKAIERQLSRLARWLREAGQGEPAADDVEVLAALGLEKYPQDIKLAGPLALAGTRLPETAYVGLPPESMDHVVPVGATALVTVENLASFNRYVREARTPEELVLFTGGFPSRAVGRAIARLAPRVETLWHWGDIDASGLRIALVVGRHAGRLPRLWMMSPDLARRHGSPAPARAVGALPPDCPAEIVALARFLDSSEAHGLEQEELDPASPTRDAPTGPAE